MRGNSDQRAQKARAQQMADMRSQPQRARAWINNGGVNNGARFGDGGGRVGQRGPVYGVDAKPRFIRARYGV